MQTFLPYPNFIGSAKVLDVRRLGKQRVENLQIMQTLLGKRVVNTHRFEPTGEYLTRYYNRYHDEIALTDVDPFDFFRQESVPIKHLVPNSKEKWRVEDLESSPWKKHPAILMWRGYESALMRYQEAICDEWINRGYKDTCQAVTSYLYFHCEPRCYLGMPEWFGEEEFHLSHQSNLLRKHPKYYSQFFHNVPDDLSYVWPSGV